MALEPAKLKEYAKRQIAALEKRLGTSKSAPQPPEAGPASRQREGPFPHSFTGMIDNLLDHHHYPMAIQILEATMSPQWHPPWYITGYLLRVRPTSQCTLDDAIRTLLAIQRVVTLHPPSKVFIDDAHFRAMPSTEVGGFRAVAENTLRIWDLLDEVVDLLSAQVEKTPVKNEPRTRTRIKEGTENQRPSGNPFQSPVKALKLSLHAPEPEIELSAPVKRELGRCILSILVWILQRDTITQQDDLRETFLYRSFRNVDRVMMRVSRALPKLLELAIEDNETPTTISLTQQFVEQLAIVSDAVGLHTNFLDTLTRALARFQTEDLEIFFDTLYSQSLKLQLARELILRIADVGPADSSITADGLVDVYLKAKPTGDGAKDAALWLRLVRLLVEMFRGYLILEAPTRTPDDTRKLTLRVATAVERMKYSKGTCLGRPMAPIVIRSDSEDEEMEEDEEGDIIDDWLDFIAEAPELLSMKV